MAAITHPLAADRPLGVVLVAGGAGAVGAAVTQLIRERGGTPVVLDLRHSPPDVDNEIVDLGRARTAEAAVRRAVERHGRLDGVVTAAGTDAPGAFDEISGEHWDHVLHVNLLGTAAVIRAALPALRRTSGRLVTVAGGLDACAERSAGAAATFGLVGLTRALAEESDGEIGVTCVLREDADAASVARAVLLALGRREADVRELVVRPPLAA